MTDNITTTINTTTTEEPVTKREILFFKVFRNLVVRTIIFDFIKGTGKKYSEIESALWISTNGHYGLLKDKLERDIPLVYEPESHVKIGALIKDLSVYKIYINKVHKYNSITISNKATKASIHGMMIDTNLVDHVALVGKLDFIKYLHDNNAELNCFKHKQAFDNACLSGSLECVLYLEAIPNIVVTKAALDNACLKGHLHIVKYLIEKRKEGGSVALSNAIENGHLEVIKYLQTSSIIDETMPSLLTTTTSAWDQAAKIGSLEVVKYLHENRNEGFTQLAINHAAMNGHLEVVKFLVENRTESCTPAALNLAAKNNHFQVCKYLLEKNVPGNNNCACNAASSNNIELVELIYSASPYRCSANSFNNICLTGNLEMIKTLTQLQTPCTSAAYEKAATNGHLHIIEYLHNIRTEIKSTPAALNLASLYGHYDVVLYLIKNRRLDCTLETALEMALFQKHEKIIKLLRSLIADPTLLNSLLEENN